MKEQELSELARTWGWVIDDDRGRSLMEVANASIGSIIGEAFSKQTIAEQRGMPQDAIVENPLAFFETAVGFAQFRYALHGQADGQRWDVLAYVGPALGKPNRDPHTNFLVDLGSQANFPRIFATPPATLPFGDPSPRLVTPAGEWRLRTTNQALVAYLQENQAFVRALSEFRRRPQSVQLCGRYVLVDYGSRGRILASTLSPAQLDQAREDVSRVVISLAPQVRLPAGLQTPLGLLDLAVAIRDC